MGTKKTEKEQAMELLGEMGKKEIGLKVSKMKWATQPSGGALEHVLSISIDLSDGERAEVEDLVQNYWELACTLSGTQKPQQANLFETEGFGENGAEGKELAD